jgi:putative transposase
MQERGVAVDQPSLKRWAIRFLPMLESVFRKRKRAVGINCRMDETYIKVRPSNSWCLLGRWSRQVRLREDLRRNTVPDKVTMDKSGANSRL